MIEVLRFPKLLFIGKKKRINLNPSKILLVKLDHIGDLVMSTPAFTVLRNRFPNAEICLLTTSSGKALFTNDPRINKIFVFNWPWPYQPSDNKFSIKKLKELRKLIHQLRKEKIDLSIDFRGDIRFVTLFGLFVRAKIIAGSSRSGGTSLLDFSAQYDNLKHEVEKSLDIVKPFKTDDDAVAQQLFITDGEITAARQYFSDCTGTVLDEQVIIVAPYSSKEVKSWPDEYFQTVILELLKMGKRVVVVGGASEALHAETLISPFTENVYSFAGKTTLRQLAALLSLSGLVVAVDSGIPHIAACFSVPIVAIFGPTRSVEYRPYSRHAVILQANTCRCNQYLHLKCDVPAGGYASCMRDLQPSKVIEVIDRILGR